MKETKRITKPGSKDRADICAVVFSGMRSGLSALKACKAAGVNQSTFGLWMNDDPALAAEYARARDDLIEIIAEEIMELSDQDVGETVDGKKDWAAVQKHKLQVDSRRWLLSKLAPKKYGDKLELSGDADNPIAISRIERVVIKK